MLIQAQTFIPPGGTRLFDVVAGVSIPEEGRALCYVADSGVGKVNLSTGSGTEYFAGVSASHTMLPTSMAAHGTAVAVGTTLTLPKTPISGQIYLYNVTESQALTLGSASNDNEYSVSGTTVTLHSGESGDTIRYAIRYTPTVEEALQEWGEGMIGAQADGSIMNTITAITKGRVATTCYLVNVAWTAGVPVKIGANGFFVPNAGSGNAVATALIHQAPSSTAPYLILDLI